MKKECKKVLKKFERRRKWSLMSVKNHFENPYVNQGPVDGREEGRGGERGVNRAYSDHKLGRVPFKTLPIGGSKPASCQRGSDQPHDPLGINKLIEEARELNPNLDTSYPHKMGHHQSSKKLVGLSSVKGEVETSILLFNCKNKENDLNVANYDQSEIITSLKGNSSTLHQGLDRCLGEDSSRESGLFPQTDYPEREDKSYISVYSGGSMEKDMLPASIFEDIPSTEHRDYNHQNQSKYQRFSERRPTIVDSQIYQPQQGFRRPPDNPYHQKHSPGPYAKVSSYEFDRKQSFRKKKAFSVQRTSKQITDFNRNLVAVNEQYYYHPDEACSRRSSSGSNNHAHHHYPIHEDQVVGAPRDDDQGYFEEDSIILNASNTPWKPFVIIQSIRDGLTPPRMVVGDQESPHLETAVIDFVDKFAMLEESVCPGMAANRHPNRAESSGVTFGKRTKEKKGSSFFGLKKSKGMREEKVERGYFETPEFKKVERPEPVLQVKKRIALDCGVLGPYVNKHTRLMINFGAGEADRHLRHKFWIFLLSFRWRKINQYMSQESINLRRNHYETRHRQRNIWRGSLRVPGLPLNIKKKIFDFLPKFETEVLLKTDPELSKLNSKPMMNWIRRPRGQIELVPGQMLMTKNGTYRLKRTLLMKRGELHSFSTKKRALGVAIRPGQGPQRSKSKWREAKKDVFKMVKDCQKFFTSCDGCASLTKLNMKLELAKSFVISFIEQIQPEDLRSEDFGFGKNNPTVALVALGDKVCSLRGVEEGILFVMDAHNGRVFVKESPGFEAYLSASRTVGELRSQYLTDITALESGDIVMIGNSGSGFRVAFFRR